MSSKKLIDQKVYQDLDEFATTLETIAKKLREEGKFTFTQGDETIEVVPNKRVKVEYEYEIESDGEHEFEIEFEWYPDRPDDGDFKVE